MTEADFSRIEAALGVRLPDAYRRALAPFPVPHERGNADAPVWDDPRALIALNRRLRAESEDWPPWLLAIGRAEGDPCGYAIDTRDPECPVWWLDRMGPGGHSGPAGPFQAWFSRWVEDTSGESGDGGFRMMIAVWLMIAVLAVVGSWAWGLDRVARGG